MEFLTNEKLTIVGAAGMIGSNMAQTAMMLKLTPNLCLYDPTDQALKELPKKCITVHSMEPILPILQISRKPSPVRHTWFLQAAPLANRA